MNQAIADFSNSFTLNDTSVLSLMDKEHGWQNKYRRIMLMGKELPAFDETLKGEENQVAGCESQVWLVASWHQDRLMVAASSDAKIVKGLVAIVLAAFNGKSHHQVLEFDMPSYLDQLGLMDQLSPSRGNGIKAIINRILSLAEQGPNRS